MKPFVKAFGLAMVGYAIVLSLMVASGRGGCAAEAGQSWPPAPQACVQRGSVCSAIAPCCPGQGVCTKVDSGGTRFSWQCR